MVRDKLIEALAVSSLYLMLKNVCYILRDVEDKGLQTDIELGVKEVRKAMDKLKGECDVYLEEFVRNHCEENAKRLKCKNCGSEINLHFKHIEYNNLHFCDKECLNAYMTGKLFF